MPGAEVRDIQALADLHRALTSFEVVAREAMTRVEREVRGTLDWLQEREQHWCRQVVRRQAEVDEAGADLRRCQQRNDRDRDCSEEERALGEARRRLRQAEEELANTRRWKARAEEAVREYEIQAKRFREATTVRSEEARAFLARRRLDLEVYTASLRASSPASEAAGPGQRPAWVLVGDAADVDKLERALAAALTVPAGSFAADAIQEKGTSVRFGEPEEGSLAHFDPEKNEIVLDEKRLRDRSDKVIAAHLTHEGTHVAWNDPAPINEDSYIDQEYHCFLAEDEVWRALKGDETDIECDNVSKIIGLGEDDAKAKLRTIYAEKLRERYGASAMRRNGQA